MTGRHQESGVPTTPFGPSVRYTVRLHVIGEGRDQWGGYKGVDRYVQYRVVTPHGELKAAATAALQFARDQPASLFSQVEITHREQEFVTAQEDYVDLDSLGR
jgi:hypothetical protein